MWGLRAERVVAGAFDSLAVVAVVLALLTSSQLPVAAVVLPAVAVLALCLLRHRVRFTVSTLDDLPGVVGAVFLGGLFSCAVLAVAGQNPVPSVITTSLLALEIVCGRLFSGIALRALRRRRVVGHRTVVVGSGSIGMHLIDVLASRRELGSVPVGLVETHADAAVTSSAVPWVATVDRLSSAVERLHVDRVVVAFGGFTPSEAVEAVRSCHRLSCEVWMVPRMFELSGAASDYIDGIPLVRARSRDPYRGGALLKRALDIAGGSALLVVLSPLMAAIALASRVCDGPGVIFRQTRVGLDGRPIVLLKFRSMRPADENESQTLWNIDTDSRVSVLGRFLRRTSLDELPQLWNVVRGDMSLVGPRPERPHFVEQFSEAIPHYRWRHRVPAGLTGLAQVSGLRGDTSVEERARLDNHYIENWSFWLDVTILMRTARALVSPRTAPETVVDLRASARKPAQVVRLPDVSQRSVHSKP